MANQQQRKFRNHLRNLLRVAERFKNEKLELEMGSFADRFVYPSEDGKTTRRYKSPVEALRKPLCGTTVCFAGRAGLDRYFRKAGLRLEYTASDIYLYVDGAPENQKLDEFFGVSSVAVDEIFYCDNEYTPTGKVSKAKTLKRIVKAIKRIGKEELGVELV